MGANIGTEISTYSAKMMDNPPASPSRIVLLVRDWHLFNVMFVW